MAVGRWGAAALGGGVTIFLFRLLAASAPNPRCGVSNVHGRFRGVT